MIPFLGEAKLGDHFDSDPHIQPGIVALLKTKDFDTLYGLLKEKNQLGVPYWVCAFSVNQHAGICARAPPTDSHGHPIQTCSCSTEKHFSGDFSDAWHSIHGWSHAHEMCDLARAGHVPH